MFQTPHVYCVLGDKPRPREPCLCATCWSVRQERSLFAINLVDISCPHVVNVNSQITRDFTSATAGVPGITATGLSNESL